MEIDNERDRKVEGGKRTCPKKRKGVLLRKGRLRRSAKSEIDLPDFYDETRVVLLPVDPYLIHIYWSITSGDLERVLTQIGGKREQVQATLRFHDTTYISLDGSNAHSSFDIPIDLQARSWYVSLLSPEKSYCVDLGLRTEKGKFSPIARSNAAETPRAWPSERYELQYMLVEDNYKKASLIPQAASPSPVQGEGEVKQSGTKVRMEAIKEDEKPLTLPSTHRVEGKANITQPINAGEVLREKLTELYRFRMNKPAPCERMPVRNPVKNIQMLKKKADITEMTEKDFIAGFSSKISALKR